MTNKQKIKLLEEENSYLAKKNKEFQQVKNEQINKQILHSKRTREYKQLHHDN